MKVSTNCGILHHIYMFKFEFKKMVVFTGTLLSLSACVSGHANHSDPTDKFDTRLRPSILMNGQVHPNWSLVDRMAYHKVPGVAIAVIEDGAVVYSEGHGVLSTAKDDPVTSDTVFSVGSVSKVAAAVMTLELEEQGKLSIDTNIDQYLTSWSIPDSEIRADKPVNLRMIMSHTAGFNVHGFADYFPGESIPTTIEVLEGVSPAKNDPVKLIFAPGTQYKYSGGGITIEQVVLSDITSTPFEALAESILFEPLGMARSSFANPLSPQHGNVAYAHDLNGELAALPRGWPTMPEQAASGLWTSADDLSIFVTMLIKGYRGTSGLLTTDTIRDMMTIVPPGATALGPRISRLHDQYSFFHPGANDNYRAWVEGNLNTGDGLIILTNGTNGDPLMAEIRNAVSDTYGWENNPVETLENFDVTEQTKREIADRYVLDRIYPSRLQTLLSTDRLHPGNKVFVDNGSLKIVTKTQTIILPFNRTTQSPSN